MTEATTSTSRWRAFRTPDTAAAIYGTIDAAPSALPGRLGSVIVA
jgi:hypothetical protein